MKLTEILFEHAKPIWDGYLKQDFVAELGRGTLSKDRFRFYMVQDYLYLLQYSKVFALGIVKSRDEESMCRFAEMVHNTLQNEMNIHKHYMKRLGITEEELKTQKMAHANTSYTSYMLEVAYGQGVLEILAAILSCAWSYEMIGENHGKIKGACEHPLFGEWVQGYSSLEYAESTKDIIDWMDALGEGISKEALENLIDIFVRCSRYEHDFWEMAYQKEM